MAEIQLERLTKKFDDFVAVDDISVTFEQNTVTCLLGPSGCGKTTLMRMVAGLETPSAGRILHGGRDVTLLRPSQRNLGMVFQYPVMYPTLSVAENIALPLKHDRSVSATERDRRVTEVLDILQMRDLAGAFIEDLDSGGRQKVAVGRAVARHSDIILFDEPTTNVEVNAKLQLIRAFKEVARRLRQTIIYVTHDQTEAMTLADRIALMRDGRIVQYDPPRDLYADCTTEFGGWFLGNPGMNFWRCALDGAESVELPFWERPIPVPTDAKDELTLGIRPEQVRLHVRQVPGSIPGRVLSKAITIGGQYLFKVAVGEETVKAKVDASRGRDIGDAAFVECPLRQVAFFSGGERLQVNDPSFDQPVSADLSTAGRRQP